MKTPLRVFLSVLIVCVLLGFEFWLNAEQPYKILFSFKQPSWSPGIEVFVGLSALVYVLFGTALFRALAGFRFPVNRSVVFTSLGILLLQTGLNFLLVREQLLPAHAAGAFVLSILGAYATFRGFKLDTVTGLVLMIYPPAKLAELVWLWDLFQRNN